jgi:hypothetical protein
MRKAPVAAVILTLLSAETVMAEDRIRITSPWGEVMADLADNDAARALAKMLPTTLRMSDHLRQEKTGNLPSPLPEAPRRRDFSPGTLGLWGSGDFVIYYRGGRVPRPGVVVLGQVDGDVSIFDRPGEVEIHLAPLAP